jgi:hypothetical protein
MKKHLKKRVVFSILEVAILLWLPDGSKETCLSDKIMNILVAGGHDSGKMRAIIPTIQSHFVLA